MKISPRFSIVFTFLILLFLLSLNGCKKSPEELESDLYTYYNRGLEFYERGYFVKAKEYLINALRAEEQLGKDDRKGDIHLFLGLIAFEYAEFERSLFHYAEAKNIFRKKLNRRREAMVENNTGNVYAATGKYDTAILHYRNSFNISRLAADKEGETIANLNTGYAYSDIGNYEKAFDYFSRAYNDYELLGKADGEITASIKMGEVYRITGAYRDALNMFYFAKETADYYNQKTFLPEIHNNLGLIYFKLGDIQAAINAYNNGYELLTSSYTDAAMKWTILINLGDVYFTQSRFARAIETYQKALLISNESREILNAGFINLKTAQTFFIKGLMEENSKDISTAKELFKSVSEFFQQNNFYPGIINAQSGIAAIAYYQKDKKLLNASIEKITDLIGNSSYKLQNRYTNNYSLTPEIFLVNDFYAYYGMLDKYESLLQKSFLFDEVQLNVFLLNQYSYDFSSSTKNQEADSLLYLQREIRHLLLEMANESTKPENIRDKTRLNYFRNKYKEVTGIHEKNEQPFLENYYGIKKDLSLQKIQNRLRENEVLLNYFLYKDSLIIISLEKDKIFSYKSELRIIELNEIINELQQAIKFNRRNDAEIILKELYTVFIEPVSNELVNKNIIYLNTNNHQYGFGDYLPFHAFIDENGKFLFENYSVHYYGGMKNLSYNIEDKKTAVIENRKQSKNSIQLSKTGLRVFDSSLPNIKKGVKDYKPVNIVSLTPIYFNIDESYNSYLELFSDTSAVPAQNFHLGEFPSLPINSAVFFHFHKDAVSPTKIFTQLFPLTERILISKFELNQNAVKNLSEIVINNLSDNIQIDIREIYQSEKDKNLNWVSLFEYIKL